MCRERPAMRSMPGPARRGFATVSAIFLLVVLSALGAFMVTFATVQHTTSAQDMQGSRAYHAARAGAEWALFQVMRPASAPPACSGNGLLPLGGTLAGFRVDVAWDCSGPISEAGVQTRVYTITSTAALGTAGDVLYVERQVRLTVER